MQVEEWEEIKRIFESALKISEAERPKFLEAACHERSGLEQTVAELLRAHEEASGFLEDESFSSSPPVFQPGQLVAERFRIVRLISRGGMGEVYDTYDERLSVRLALKTLRPEYASDCEALERFRREIRVTRNLVHPNLCRVYELVEHRLPPDDHASGERVITCLTMQLLCGETLEQHLAKSGPLTPEAALPLIRQIAEAIEILHENGIIHRDLKPSNIMIVPGPDEGLRAIVMDFGLTKPFSPDRDLFESRSDFRAGAPFYLAPELVRGDKPSIASDIYAFALIIDEMVTGGGAFSGDTVESLLYQKLWSEPKDPAERRPGLPQTWCAVIRRCLNRDPGKRIDSAKEIVSALASNSWISRTVRLPLLYRVQKASTWNLCPWPILSRRGTVILGLIAGLAAAGVAMGYIGSRPLNTSVLIFEFENLTGKAENDLLSKGTTWEVERLVSEIPGVSVNYFHEPRPKSTAFKPNTQFSIDGYLEADKNITRLLVKVTENSTGRIVWMNRYDTTVEKSLQMQDDIASGAVSAMRDAILLPHTSDRWKFLSKPESLLLWLHKFSFFRGGRVGMPATKSEEAMEAYTRGRTLWEERRLGSEREAVKQYQRALKADSNFVLAEADLAGVYLSLIQTNAARRTPLLKEAEIHAVNAVRKGPEWAESYTSLAAVRQAQLDWSGAERNYRKAIELNPRLALAHRWYGGFLLQFGRFDEALRETRRAIELDPYDRSVRFSLGTYLFYSGKLQEDVDVLRAALEEHDAPWGHQALGYAYALIGARSTNSQRRSMLDNALNEARIVSKSESAELKPGQAGTGTPMFALIYALRGDRAKSRAYLRTLVDADKSESLLSIDLIDTYVALGEYKPALDLLNRAAEAKDAGLLYIKVDPFLEPLRQSDEFRNVLSRIGL